jgi:hypothetical protein
LTHPDMVQAEDTESGQLDQAAADHSGVRDYYYSDQLDRHYPEEEEVGDLESDQDAAVDHPVVMELRLLPRQEYYRGYHRHRKEHHAYAPSAHYRSKA